MVRKLDGVAHALRSCVEMRIWKRCIKVEFLEAEWREGKHSTEWEVAEAKVKGEQTSNLPDCKRTTKVV